MMFPKYILLGVVGVALTSCGEKHDHAHGPVNEKQPAAPAGATNRIPIPATVRDNLGITFAQVEFRQVAATRRYPGRFESEADARREYRAPVAGIVEILVRPYQHVAAGEPLARISGRGWAQLQREWMESHSSAVAGDDSVASAVASRRTLILAQIAAAAGLAVDDPRIKELTKSPSLTLHARAPGVIEPVMATTGTMVEESASILATLDPSRVRLRASVPQGDLSQLNEKLPARIVQSRDGWRDGMPARLAFGLEADHNLRTHDLVAWLQPAETKLPTWVRPGVAALLEIQLAGGEGELAIPVTATIRDGLETIIFRRDPADPNQVIRMSADLGVSDGTWVEILSGVADGDEVVVEGIYQLKLSGAGKAQLGGHFHADGTFHAEDNDGEGH
jgi:hypothetical protein